MTIPDHDVLKQLYFIGTLSFGFLLMGAELAWSFARGRRVYRLNDTVVNVSCAIAQTMTELFIAAGLVAGYAYVYEQFHLLSFERRPVLLSVIAFVGVDFLYYWLHRLSHRTNILWAVHVVHHQSEDYNFPVAARRSWLSHVASWPFYLPLALIGVPPVVFALADAFGTYYQYWLHTQTIGKLGILESVLCTPSLHRVHHGREPKYLGKNYGAVFIIWDRLFGTWQPEEALPTFGLHKPVQSFNPLWAQVHHWVDLWKMAWRAPSVFHALQLLFKPPFWAPPWMERTKPAAPFVKYDPPLPRSTQWYVGIQLALIQGATITLVLQASRLPKTWLVVGATVVLVSLFAFGGLLERKPWARRAELFRLGLFWVAVVTWSWSTSDLIPAGITATVLVLLCGAWFLSISVEPATEGVTGVV